MNWRNVALGIIGAILVLFLLLGCSIMGTYNSLQSKRQNVKVQWGQVQTSYQRRADLIPNLVESVRGSMKQEKEVFGAIAEARTRYAGAKESGSVKEQVAATQNLETAIGRLLVIMENYPELKSSDRVHDLMVELEGTENRVNVERKRYNDKVREYNDPVVKFPTNIIASTFGFREEAYFKAEAGSEKAPKVDFSK